MTEALEIRIENAWRTVCGLAKSKTTATLYLTPRFTIYDLATKKGYGYPPSGSQLIGTYNRHIRLEDFRADVFFVAENMHRGQ